MVSTLRSGSLCPSCVCPKVPPASSPESSSTQRKTLLGAWGCACSVERPRVRYTTQVQRGRVENDRQLAALRSTPLHKSLAQVGQVAVSDAETCHRAAAGLPLIACRSTGDFEKMLAGFRAGSLQTLQDFASFGKPSDKPNPPCWLSRLHAANLKARAMNRMGLR